MQTFLPYPNFYQSAQILDRARLGKQRVEVLQLIRGQWSNHPASLMWRGHEYQLGVYGIAVCREWIGRGYRDTCLDKITQEMQNFKDTGLPKWIGDSGFHQSHQSNLLRKDLLHYRKFFPNLPADLPYVWPKP